MRLPVTPESRASLSDLEPELTDLDSSDSAPMNTQLKTPARSQSQSQPSHTVSKPKHQSTKQFHSSTSTSLSLVSDFLQQKAALEKERFKMLCQHEAQQEEEKDHKQEKGRKSGRLIW